MITNYIVIKMFVDTTLNYFGRLTQEGCRSVVIKFGIDL